MKRFIFIALISLQSFLVSANEVQILDEVTGDGLVVVNHSKLTVHYIGRLEDNTEFDNSYNRDQYFQFQIGTRQVIQGWENGLLGMKEGGKRTIYIPYQLAYGEKGVGELIPPKSNLIFEIELIKVTPPKYKELDANQIKLAMSDSNFTIIDIRHPNKINNSGKIPGSIIITAFDENGNFIQDFLNKYQQIIETDTKVIFVSEKGIISSILANGFVEKLNQKNIYHLKSGIEGLKKINFEFEDN